MTMDPPYFPAEYLYSLTFALCLLGIYLAYYLSFRRPHFLIKGRYPIRKKNIGSPPPPYPNGWYNILHSSQLKAGEVKSIDIAGENLAVFRGQDGKVYALEAYCLHMGANLGVGGTVKNRNCIMCPFHGWLYNGDSGKCVDHDGKPLKLPAVEYNCDLGQKGVKLDWKKHQPQEPTLRRFPVSEVNQYIYVWVHAMKQHQSQPLYPMMNLELFLKPLVLRGITEHHVACHVQDIPENGSDVLHFKYVHTQVLPWLKSIRFNWSAKWKRGDDPSLPQLFEHPKPHIRAHKQKIYDTLIAPFPRKDMLSIGNLENFLELPLLGSSFVLSGTIIQIGLPIVFVVIKSPLYELVFHHYIRPAGPAMQEVFHDCFISPWLPYWVTSFISKGEGQQVTNDMWIWESKQFARKAHLVEGRESDALIKGWREWSSQHYEGCVERQRERQKHEW